MINPKATLLQIGVKSDAYDQNMEKIRDLLLNCSGDVRKKICKIYGFKIEMSGDELLIYHDGKTVGSGQILINGIKNTFEIYPKNDGLKINEMVSYFENGIKNYGAIHNFYHQGVESKLGDYSFSFLIGLLAEISSFGTHFFNIYSTRKKIISPGKPRGRIDQIAFVKDQLAGKHNIFACEVLDNKQLRQFATVFYFTAMSIVNDLNQISSSNVFKGLDVVRLKKIVSNRLRPYVVEGFSRQLITRLSKPPYPFGVKELFIRCLKYWTGKGQISAASNLSSMRFSGFSLRLNDLFEDYVGLVFDKVIKKEKISGAEFRFSKDLTEDRSLKPDHIFIDDNEKKLYIIEVKYSNKVAVREHVSQLISYLDYKYDKWPNYEKFGFLVYPDDKVSCETLDEFNHKMKICKLNSIIDKSCNLIDSEIKFL